MKRHLAALLLAAVALLGLQRVPCLLAATVAALHADAGALPPCHRPPASPAERSSPCSQCASLHRLVASALAVADTSPVPAMLLGEAPAQRSSSAAHAGFALAERAVARAPDPLRTSTVRLL